MTALYLGTNITDNDMVVDAVQYGTSAPSTDLIVEFANQANWKSRKDMILKLETIIRFLEDGRWDRGGESV